MAGAVTATLLAAETSHAQVGAVFPGIGHPRGFGLPVGGFFPFSPFGYTSFGFAPFGYGFGGYPFGYGYGGYGGYGLGMYPTTSYGYYWTYTYVSAPALPRSSSSHLGTPGRTALIEVRVPADAEVWFDGTKSDQTGAERSFRSKPLEADTTYTFEVKARWTENDKPVERTRKVRLMAGEHVRLAMPSPGP
jgi:uncharacterized protein (TIGR03000 family)